jgi:hypothetical protein
LGFIHLMIRTMIKRETQTGIVRGSEEQGWGNSSSVGS